MEQSRRIIKLNNKGQFAIEAVLLMTLFIGIFAASMNTLKKKQFVQKLTDTSVAKVKNLSEYGTWKQNCKAMKGGSSQTAANCHPNSINRALSSDPQ
ncbi:MAG: hypothetical protein H7Z71_10100 [Moraxellaceae bacterium]|nr:hypothetical protein [Pseudobdellovibrionaceae bacterium]